MSNTIDLNDNNGLRAAAAALRSSGWLRLATIVEQHIAEVERLRAEVERRRDVYDLMGAVEHSANNLAAREDMGALRERAAVVAWLQEWATPQSDWYDLSVRSSVLLEASDRIERGEHRREEER